MTSLGPCTSRGWNREAGSGTACPSSSWNRYSVPAPLSTVVSNQPLPVGAMSCAPCAGPFSTTTCTLLHDGAQKRNRVRGRVPLAPINCALNGRQCA
ncbi:hypothetical protein OKW38_006533 [Paraburkholderia sp. MM5496-R1]